MICIWTSGHAFTTDEQVRFLLRDHHEALERWREAVTPSAGRPPKNDNNITNSERVTGTSKAYLLKRLNTKERPGAAALAIPTENQSQLGTE